jgi:hypothetical protein
MEYLLPSNAKRQLANRQTRRSGSSMQSLQGAVVLALREIVPTLCRLRLLTLVARGKVIVEAKENTMTKHFYAADYANYEQIVSSFTEKTARNNFVDDGRYCRTLPVHEADALCMKQYLCKASEAVLRGFI